MEEDIYPSASPAHSYSLARLCCAEKLAMMRSEPGSPLQITGSAFGSIS